MIALYARVTTKTIQAVTGPLEHLKLLMKVRTRAADPAATSAQGRRYISQSVMDQPGGRRPPGKWGLAQLQAMSAIETCRTAALGGHVESCEDCGHRRIAYNSCRGAPAWPVKSEPGPARVAYAAHDRHRVERPSASAASGSRPWERASFGRDFGFTGTAVVG